MALVSVSTWVAGIAALTGWGALAWVLLHRRASVEKALQASETTLRLAARAARFGVFEHDLVTGQIWCSQEYRQLHGFSPDEPVTMAMLDAHLHPEDAEVVRGSIRRAHDPNGDGALQMVLRARTRDGRDVWVEARAQTLFAGRGAARRALRTVGAVHDVTERYETTRRIALLNAGLELRVRERTAELEQAVQELEAFSYSVSHDLRAPLRGIDGFARLLAERSAGQLDDAGRDYLGRIRSQTARMGQLIDDLLMLSRVGSGTLVRHDCDLSMLAEAVATALHERHPQSCASVSVQPGLRAHGDLGLLKVVFENLIGNAWKYSAPCPTPQIEVGRYEVECAVPEGGRHGLRWETVFFVRDNGVGFDMKQVAKLFNPFQRLHSGPQFEGSGIGLATVRRIVAKHGGRAWAESIPGQETRFSFTLAAAENRRSPTPASPESQLPESHLLEISPKRPAEASRARASAAASAPVGMISSA